MIKFKGKLLGAVIATETMQILTIEAKLNKLSINAIKSLENEKTPLEIEIKKQKDKRSNDANAYCWVLLDKIAEKLKNTKENIYREIIKRVGVFEILPIKNEAVTNFMKRWQSKGIGWVCEILGASPKLDGYTKVIAYYGTSTYSKKEMARFIDEVIEEAKKLEIETKTPNEIAELVSLWSE